MSSLSASLPKPKKTILTSKWANSTQQPKQTPNQQAKQTLIQQPINQSHISTPKYGERQSYRPSQTKDYFDGGSFPEIRIVQFPLDMGRSQTSNANRSTLPLQTDKDGIIRYDMILHQNIVDGKVLHSTYDALKPNALSEEALKPINDADTTETSERTRLAMEKVIQGKIKQTQPSQIVKSAKEESGQPEFIKYTPQNAEHENGVASRIIRMAQVQVDPFDPPKFKHKRIANPPGSPPAPVLHSPPRQVTVEERLSWVIPPCISNWKNAKGYTIPLDKRLAADGRGIQDIQINDNFAKLAEALYVADRHVREEVKIRSEMQMKLANKDKKDKEEKLRQLAQRARDERAGIQVNHQVRQTVQSSESDASSEEDEGEEKTRDNATQVMQKQDERRERDKIRQELSEQHSKSLRYPQKLENRDVSEKIALGRVQPTQNGSQYDQRLFNQSSGMSSGFGTEDAYAIYDKPLFAGSSANLLYRAKNNEDSGDIQGIERLLEAPHQGFKGADGNKGTGGPVEFEKEDVFGVDAFMEDAKRGRRGNDDENDDENDRRNVKETQENKRGRRG